VSCDRVIPYLTALLTYKPKIHTAEARRYMDLYKYVDCWLGWCMDVWMRGQAALMYLYVLHPPQTRGCPYPLGQSSTVSPVLAAVVLLLTVRMWVSFHVPPFRPDDQQRLHGFPSGRTGITSRKTLP
jgi:hypothetical protein